MGGLIVIDFIDMRQYKNQKAIENAMRTAVRKDRARVSVGGISRFGLMEMSRQRLRPSLDDSAYKICPHCNGIGKVRSTESLALSVLRLVGEEARKEKTKSVIANIPPDAANYLHNEKREWINEIEEREKIDIVLTADPELSSVNFTITRVRTDGTEIQGGSNTQAHSHGDDNKKNGSSSRLNTEHEPVKAWDIEDMRGPNLIDKIKFWFTAPTKKKKPSKKKKQQPRKKASEKRSRKSHSSSRGKPRSNKKAKSDASKAEKDKKRKKKDHSKANKKASKKPSRENKIKADEKDSKKKVTKKPTKKPLKKKAKPEGDKKSADTKKADGRKPKQRNKKDEKNSQVKKKESKTKADKEIKTSDSKKTSTKTKKSSKATSDKVLPWEDIVPPK